MIEDILYCQYGEFICNNAVANVVVTAPGAGADVYRIGPGWAIRYFAPKDNFIIKAISLDLPYAFISAATIANLEIYGVPAAGPDFVFPELGTGSTSIIHSENVEIEKNVYIAFTLAAKFALRGKLPLAGWSVCCLNAPAILNTVTMPIYSSIRIIHNIPLVV